MSFVAESVAALEIYGVLGLAFALAFAWRGARAIDPGARSGTLGFRVLIVPGALALWPYLALRWIRSAREPGDQP